MNPLINGVVVGVTLAFLIGPALFVLLQTSILRGFKAGILIALGIFLSDLTVLLLCHAGISQFLGADPRQNLYFGIIGGIVLIIFGTVTFSRKAVPENSGDDVEVEIKVPAPMIFVLKGYFLNIANPGVWFVWVTALVGVSSAYGVNNRDISLFFAGALVTILATDTLKSFIAHKIKHLLSDSVILWTNRAVGIVLIVIGTFLIMSVFVDLRSMIPFTH
ncbi:MAG: LysE family transporter [Bacteroidales bacterium]|nr:LysE family transporter [Bacteroidales bacterium]